MKLPSIARTSKPPAGSRWKVAAAVNVDLPGIPSYSPKVGDELRAEHPFVQFCFANHATNLLVPASASTDELQNAYARNLFPSDLPPSTPTTDIRLGSPSKNVMRCISAIQVGSSLIAVGSLADANDQFVRKYPANWEPAPADGYSAS
jgi:hypothetical protein